MAPREGFPATPELAPVEQLQRAVDAVRANGDVLDRLGKTRTDTLALTVGLGVSGTATAILETPEEFAYHMDLLPAAVANYAAGVVVVAGVAKVIQVRRRVHRAEGAWARQEHLSDSLEEPVELLRIPTGEDKHAVHLHWGLRADEPDTQQVAARLKNLAINAEKTGVTRILFSRELLPEGTLSEEAPKITLQEALKPKGRHAMKFTKDQGEDLTSLTPAEAIEVAESLIEDEVVPLGLVQQALERGGMQKGLVYNLVIRYQKAPTAANKFLLTTELRKIIEPKLRVSSTSGRDLTDPAVLASGGHTREEIHSEGRLMRGKNVRWQAPGRDPEVRPNLFAALEVALPLPKLMGMKGAVPRSRLVNTALVTAWESLTTRETTVDDADNGGSIRGRVEIVRDAAAEEPAYLVQEAAIDRFVRNTDHKFNRRDWKTPEGLSRVRRSVPRAIGAAGLTLLIAFGVPLAVGYANHQQIKATQNAFADAFAKAHGYKDAQAYDNDTSENKVPFEEYLQAWDQAGGMQGVNNKVYTFSIDVKEAETNTVLHALSQAGLRPDDAILNKAEQLAQTKKAATDERESGIGNAGTAPNQPLWTIEGDNAEGYFAQFSSSEFCDSRVYPGTMAWSGDSLKLGGGASGFLDIELPTTGPTDPNLKSFKMTAAHLKPGQRMPLPILNGYQLVGLKFTDSATGQPVPTSVYTDPYGEIFASDDYRYKGGSEGFDVTLWQQEAPEAGIKIAYRNASVCEEWVGGAGEPNEAQIRADLRNALAATDPTLLTLKTTEEAAAYIQGHFGYAVNPLNDGDMDYIQQVKRETFGFVETAPVSGETYKRLVATLYKNGKLNCNLATTLLAIVHQANGFTDNMVVVSGYHNSNDPADKPKQYISTNEAHLYAMVQDPVTGKSKIVDATPGGGLSAEDQEHFKEGYSPEDLIEGLAERKQAERLKLLVAEGEALLLLMGVALVATRGRQMYGFTLGKQLQVMAAGEKVRDAATSTALDGLVAYHRAYLARQGVTDTAKARELVDVAFFARPGVTFTGDGGDYAKDTSLEQILKHVPLVKPGHARKSLAQRGADPKTKRIAGHLVAMQRRSIQRGNYKR